MVEPECRSTYQLYCDLIIVDSDKARCKHVLIVVPACITRCQCKLVAYVIAAGQSHWYPEMKEVFPRTAVLLL